MQASGWRGIVRALPAVLLPFAPAAAQSLHQGEVLHITRAVSPVRVDGELNDEAWKAVQPVQQWYEFNPGDNVAPTVESVGYLSYDDRFLYAAFEFTDPDPKAIRAPYADRDRIDGNHTDFGGLFIDARNDGHSAVLLLVTPSGVQYDAVTDDAASENASPDFFWDSAARITGRGWTLEIRVPFSSLRYRNVDAQTWGIALYRNYPRDFRYQIASARIPRGSNCTVCLINTLSGLERLPSGGHVVAAPYLNATSVARPRDGLGSPLSGNDVSPQGGLDLKWNPNADTAVDLAVNPDFSQVEADTAQITANELFALSYPEKRPFFLEGVELLSTPIRAVYTRSITDPRWGGRVTGTAGGFTYTALLTEDAGGGGIVIPGPTASTVAPQNVASYVTVARLKRDIGRSFVSLLATDREDRHGGGYNTVAGPDFQWRYSTSQVVTGQWLVSNTGTRAQGGSVSHGLDVQWSHQTRHLELSSRYKDAGDAFRADTGFVPQVGFRELFARGGWTVRPTGFVRQLRMYATATQQTDRSGGLIMRAVTPTAAMNVRWSGFVQLRLIEDRVRSRDQLFDRRQFGFLARFSPSPRVAEVQIDATAGSNVDFSDSRPARGATVNLSTALNLTRRLSIGLVQNQRWLNVDVPAGGSGRLLMARVSRVRGNYMFTASSFVRVIAQYASTRWNPSLFRSPVRDRSGTLSASALFAYKLNWQSVLFVGYGDDRELSPEHELEKTGRQFFTKVSYAFQR
jgi:hypothetical protein